MSKRMRCDEDQGYVDRISRLPEPIIHNIMFQLPTKDVARVPALSKRFNSLWRSFPIIVFDLTSFKKPSVYTGRYCGKDIDRFLRYATRSIQLRRLSTDLERFCLKLEVADTISDFSRVDRLILFALVNGVKELDLYIKQQTRLGGTYKLMEGFSSKSVTSLKLCNIKFDLNWLISGCPSVKSLDLRSCKVSEDHTINTSCGQLLHMLSFRNVNITEKWVEHNISSLGNLASLLICGCTELKNIVVSNKKLERVVVVGTKLESLEVIAPELRSLHVDGGQRGECAVNIGSSSVLLRNLSLTAACITDRLKEQISKFSYIDTLKLQKCRHLSRIEICNDRLQSLKLLEFPYLNEVIIDAPQLQYFSYSGKVTKLGMMNTPCLRNCKLSLDPISAKHVNLDDWNLLRDTLTFFGICKALTLECKSEQDLIFPKDVTDSKHSPLYDLKQLKIIGPWRTINVSLVDKFLWLAPHLETLCIVPWSKVKVTIKMHYEKEVRKDRNLICCKDLPVECWRHDLERVEIKNLESLDPQELEQLLKYFGQSA